MRRTVTVLSTMKPWEGVIPERPRSEPLFEARVIAWGHGHKVQILFRGEPIAACRIEDPGPLRAPWRKAV